MASVRMTYGMSRRRAEARPSIRAEHAERTRTRLIEAGLALLARGAEDLTLRAVAVEAGISERTLYRYFETREQFAEALSPRLRERSSVPLPGSAEALNTYARALFETFERNRPLIEGMLASEGAREDLRRSRARNLEAMRALIDASFPRAPKRDRIAAATALRVLLAGSSWVYLRVSCGLENEALIAHAEWTIEAILARLGSPPRKSRGRAR